MNRDDDDVVDVERLQRPASLIQLGALNYQRPVHHLPPPTYSLTYIRHTLVRNYTNRFNVEISIRDPSSYHSNHRHHRHVRLLIS